MGDPDIAVAHAKLICARGRIALAYARFIGLQNVAASLLLERFWKQEQILTNLPFMTLQHPFYLELPRVRKGLPGDNALLLLI